MSLTRNILLLVFFVPFLATCRDTSQDDTFPSVTFYVNSSPDKENSIKIIIEEFAAKNNLSSHDAHYLVEFGCSNVYSLMFEQDEIFVINAFDYNYDVIVYDVAGGYDVSRLKQIAKNLAGRMTKAPPSKDPSLCSTG